MDDGMSAGRWQTIKQVFTKALALEGPAREAFLGEACADDEALCDEVRALLEAHEGSGPVDELQNKVMAPLYAQFNTPTPEGRRIGRYEVTRELGRGGMGSVYLAKRADGQFEQQVALKLLRTDLTSQGQMERFLVERQILARLNHPNIARLFDGGVTNEGQPFFVMEHIEGQSLDRYCDGRELSIGDRLALFLTVCDAVQYAHRALVVHRDLKPSNILVTEDGTVKLLDFGIAKLLNPDASGLLDPESELSHASLHTRTGLLPMTPAYASPEQVRGEAITTASDVYQLGIVLYELLTGHRPYRVSGRTPSEVERIICEEEPVRPSTAVTQAPTSDGAAEIIPEEIGRARQTSLEQLRSRLRGDLDTIVLKALRKEPERRYESAEQLVEDVRRHLEGRPVTVHPDTWRYRAGKFARRHRWGVAVAAVIALLLIGYAATVTWYSQQTRAALQQAQQEAEKSKLTIDFLVNMFERANPYQAAGPSTMFSDTLTTRELLDLGTTRVRQELSGQPDVQATMMYTLGRIYRQLGRYEEAAPLLEDALALQREHLPDAHPELTKSLHELARLLRHKGESERAERLYREALAIQRLHLGDEHPDIAENLSELGIIAAREGRFGRADSLFRKVLAMRESLHGPDHPDVATALQALGQLHMLKEELPEAERLLRRSLAIRQNHSEFDHPLVAEPMDRLGQVLVMQGKTDEAEPLLRQALAIREELFPEVHPSRAVSLNNMGRLLRKKGDYAAADQLLREAQAIYQEMYGPENMDAAGTLFERAQVYHAKGDYAAAETLYKQAIEMQQSLHGLENRYTQRFLAGLDRLYEAWGPPDSASRYRALLVELEPQSQ